MPSQNLLRAVPFRGVGNDKTSKMNGLSGSRIKSNNSKREPDAREELLVAASEMVQRAIRDHRMAVAASEQARADSSLTRPRSRLRRIRASAATAARPRRFVVTSPP